MNTPRIKICGITSPEAVDMVAESRADFGGFIFHPPSPRNLSIALAAELTRQAAGRFRRVGLFVDASDDTLGAVLAAAQLDALQLQGKETPERVAQIRSLSGLPVWKAISVASAADIERALAYRDAADFILFDAKTPKGALPGGMGLSFDWTLLAGYRGPLPWGLAGGLNPENVAEAIRIASPPMVDVCSGTESAPGVKDVDRVAAFCQAARNSRDRP